jgi:predicted TIM-barrel fold metal-dependent hydrolase
MDDRLIIVSSDAHAGMPPECWPEYLPAQHHELLPQLAADNEIYTHAITVLSAKRGSTACAEFEEAHATGWHGLHDPVLRLADMDREGIASEIVFHADHRLGDLFHNAPNRTVPFDVWDAGVRGWNRWAHDTFGFARDRFHLTAAIGSCTDMDATVAELGWVADRGFIGTYVPGYLTHPEMPPLFDEWWEPFWSACEVLGLAVFVHAGFGTRQGTLLPQMEKIYRAAADAAGTTDLAAMVAHADAVPPESVRFFTDFLNHNVDSRRPLWQMTLGGVFDRHPDLKLVLTEIRLDWMPATFRHLDAVFDDHRRDLPARRPPSEYWPTNCMSGASFIHKAEVEMRHEVGVETIAFGRDYPHPEGTWPHTTLWLQDAFFGVPDAEVRLMLGENAIRGFGLDRDRLAAIAARIGPRVHEINGTATDIRPDVRATFEMRGYYKPPEGDDRIPLIEPLLGEDLAGFVSSHVGPRHGAR